MAYCKTGNFKGTVGTSTQVYEFANLNGYYWQVYRMLIIFGFDRVYPIDLQEV